MSNNEERKMAVTGLCIDERKCECYGWNKHPIILTLHHVFPKNLFTPQPNFSRKYRYVIACPTCHTLIHVGLMSEGTKKLIVKKMNECERVYCNYNDIEGIISKCRRYYNI